MKKINKKSVITLVIILVGLVISVYGALNYQNILSHAGSNDYTNFKVTDGQDTPIYCDNNGQCTTSSLDVKLQIKDINQFTNP